MSAVTDGVIVHANNQQHGSNKEALGQGQPVRDAKQQQHSNYKGFVAGVFSGVSKLTGEIT